MYAVKTLLFRDALAYRFLSLLFNRSHIYSVKNRQRKLIFVSGRKTWLAGQKIENETELKTFKLLSAFGKSGVGRKFLFFYLDPVGRVYVVVPIFRIFREIEVKI